MCPLALLSRTPLTVAGVASTNLPLLPAYSGQGLQSLLDARITSGNVKDVLLGAPVAVLVILS